MVLTKKKVEKKTEEEKVEERREEVLAAGRKFKYPLQWTKHRVVINTVLVALIVIAMLFIGGWLALYKLGRTDDLLFRVTMIIPAPVASVDSENVRFSDYLMFYRSSVTSIERQSSTQTDNESKEALIAEYKRSALDEAERYTYAYKLSRELGIEVSDDEVEAEFERHRKVGGIDRSEEGFIKIIEDNFGLSKNEYKRMLYLALIKAKVEMAIDDDANRIAEEVDNKIAGSGGNFKVVAEAMGDAVVYEETGGMVDSKNVDGGRASEAMKLEPGQNSGKIVSMNGDGYYFVKLVKKTETEVDFVSIKIPFNEFKKRYETLSEEGKIKEYISIGNTEENANEGAEAGEAMEMKEGE